MMDMPDHLISQLDNSFNQLVYRLISYYYYVSMFIIQVVWCFVLLRKLMIKFAIQESLRV